MFKQIFLVLDIDECANNPCHIHANCVNVPSTFMCTCKTGFTGDGKSCIGKHFFFYLMGKNF